MDAWLDLNISSKQGRAGASGSVCGGTLFFVFKLLFIFFFREA